MYRKSKDRTNKLESCQHSNIEHTSSIFLKNAFGIIVHCWWECKTGEDVKEKSMVVPKIN